MDFINNIVNSANDLLWSYLLIALLIFSGLFFTWKTKFVQFRNIGDMFKLLGEKDDSINDDKSNSVSSFQAFCIGTASRVGTGNLAGVATAIAIGGPGAVFWMWLIALLGSASAFIESTLAQIYKVKDGDSFRGGPAYYMEKGLNKRWMGIAFSILIALCFGFAFNSLQSNTIAGALYEPLASNEFISNLATSNTMVGNFVNMILENFNLVIGLVLAILTAIIVFGGVNRIAKISSVIVPVMAIAYILVALFVIVKNFGEIPSIIKLILDNAFGIKEAVAGGIGAALTQGIKRGLFSNEAGMGSAPNAAATATVSHPVKQGLIQTLGVFTDTLIICTSTALIILISGIPLDANTPGITMTQLSLSSEVGSWGSSFIAICILLFAFSSIIGNYYYGETNIQFISENKGMLLGYRILVCVIVLLGAIAPMSLVWNIADIFMGLMAILNIIAIIPLSKIAFKALEDYRAQKAEGKNPVFKASSIPELGDEVEFWQ